MKTWVENNISLVFLFFCFLGLTLPGMEKFSASSTIFLIATVIFLACFKIPFHAMPRVSWPSIMLFYSVRFIIFPVILYFCLLHTFPSIAIAAFLFALLPPATSSPAMSHLFEGNVSLSFIILIVGNLLTPITLPIMVDVVLNKVIAINMSMLFVTLLFSIVLPFIIFLGLRRNKILSSFAQQHGSFTSILLIGMAITIATARRKAMILHSPDKLLWFLLVISIEFCFFYLLGLLLSKKSSIPNKISYSLGSGSNNVSLGISIALLYFPAEISIFFIVAQLPWILAFMPFKRWVISSQKKLAHNTSS
jgi:predicted Na+-dependent transporter